MDISKELKQATAEQNVGSSLEAEKPATYWICDGPFFHSSLHVASRDRGHYTIRLQFFDAEGREVNTAELEGDGARCQVFELGEFLEGCGLESGLRHGTLLLNCTSNVSHALRFYTRERATFLSDRYVAYPDQPCTLPVTLRQRWKNVLALLNPTDQECMARVRCICGNRKPEIIVGIPPKASRVLGLEQVFADMVPEKEVAQVRSYIRISMRGEQHCVAQLLEWCQSTDALLVSGIQ